MSLTCYFSKIEIRQRHISTKFEKQVKNRPSGAVGVAQRCHQPPHPLLRRACSSPVVKFCRKISVTYFNFWKVACWRRVTLLKMNTFIWYFSKILVIVVEELYYITAFCKTTNFAEQQILQNTSRKLLLCRENLRIF